MADESQDQKAKVVKSYFASIINGYLVNDINTLLNDELDKKEQGGCTAPLAMTIFSAMNQLGYLVNKKDTKEIVENAETATETCIKEFCNDWMQKINKIYKKSTIQEMIVHLFRHGMAHQFLSIYQTAITRDPKQETLIGIFKNESDEKLYVLQVKILATDFLEAVKSLDDKIDRAMGNDHDFILRFYERLVLQRQKYSKKNVSLLNKVEKNLEKLDGNEIMTSTTTSGIEAETSQTIDRSLELPD